MAKKDFDAINTERAETGVTTGQVFTTIEKGKDSKQRQGTASPEEQQERANSLRTQGRKGCKANRINMAFTPDNFEFIRILSRIRGENMTQFTNFVIAKYREEHPELMEKALQLIKETEL